MIYLDINLDHLCTSNNNIGCVYPNVRIGMDCADNVDVQKLRDFQQKLQRYIERGINDCLVLEQPTPTKETHDIETDSYLTQRERK